MKLEGIIAYPITPFKTESQEVDFDALTITLNALLEHQCDAIAPLGSAGESLSVLAGMATGCTNKY